MTPIIELTVYGVAQPQGNKTGFVRGGKVVMVEGKGRPAQERFKDWRGAVASAARDWQAANPTELIDGPVYLAVTFHLPKPKSTKKRKTWQTSRPDLDKLIRAVMDGLTGVVWTNDSRVVHVCASKPFGDPPRAEIRITQPEGEQ